MLKTMKSGITFAYPLDMKSEFKCEGYRGIYSMIDAVTWDDDVYVLLEHNWYGDETELLLAVLPRDCFKWYVVETSSGKTKKYFFISSPDILEETYDSIDIALSDHYPDVEEDEMEFWTDEEINNIEGD